VKLPLVPARANSAGLDGLPEQDRTAGVEFNEGKRTHNALRSRKWFAAIHFWIMAVNRPGIQVPAPGVT